MMHAHGVSSPPFALTDLAEKTKSASYSPRPESLQQHETFWLRRTHHSHPASSSLSSVPRHLYPPLPRLPDPARRPSTLSSCRSCFSTRRIGVLPRRFGNILATASPHVWRNAPSICLEKAQRRLLGRPRLSLRPTEPRARRTIRRTGIMRDVPPPSRLLLLPP